MSNYDFVKAMIPEGMDMSDMQYGAKQKKVPVTYCIDFKISDEGAKFASGAILFAAGFLIDKGLKKTPFGVIMLKIGESSSTAFIWGLAFNALETYAGGILENALKSLNSLSCDGPPGPPLYLDPLVINLDGKGIKLTNVATNTAYFDFAGDGFRERTGWVAPGTGFVVLDKNGNGNIDNGSELFGGPGEDGLAALAKFDADGNGRIDRNDTIFSQLRIWVDDDGDAVTDAGELKTLAELGIRAILLNRETCGCEQFGNRFIVRGAFEYENGQKGQIAAIEFLSNPADSVWVAPKDFKLSALAESLPVVRGFGSIPHLQAAATLDPNLAEKLRAFVLSCENIDFSTLRANFTEILFAWANVDGVDPGSRGPLVDARKIAFLSKLYNNGLYDTINLSQVPAALAANWTWDHISDMLLTRVLRGVPLSAMFLTGDAGHLLTSPLLPLLSVTDRASLAIAVGEAVDALSSDPDTARHGLDLFLFASKGFSNLYFNNDDAAMRKVVLDALAAKVGITIDASLYNGANAVDLVALFTSAADPRGAIIAIPAARVAGADVLIGTSSADVLTGTADGSVLLGGAGNDMLRGGQGNDLYIWKRGHGNDTIDEAAGQRWDQNSVQFAAGITASQVRVVREGEDVRLIIAPSSPTANDGGSILILRQAQSWETGIHFVRFADGTVWNWDDLRIKALTITGTTGNDTILGATTRDWFWNDTISGGAGNDMLRGGQGNDLYIWNRGHGNDTIDEAAGQRWDQNSVQFAAGITASQVRVVREGEDVRLIIAPSSPTANDGGSILILRQAQSWETGIHFVRFADGTVWNWDDLRTKALTITGTRGNDTILGATTYDWFWNDTISGGAGNDLLRGGNGGDTYIWNRGDGNDTIDEAQQAWGFDAVQFAAGITASQVRVVREGDDVRLIIAPSSPTAKDGGSILILRQAQSWYNGVEFVRFADGTAWNWDDLATRALTITGTSGNDTIIGATTYDWLWNDTISGGAGNDMLRGGQGNDLYIWNRGDGNDTVDEAAGQGSDVLSLGVLWTATRVQRSGSDLLVTIEKSSPTSNDGGSVRIKDYFLGEMRGIEAIQWADGSVWDRTKIDTIASSTWGTAGNDTLRGTKGTDNIFGHLGNDSIIGDDGNDVLNGGLGNDALEGGAGNDELWGMAGTDSFVFRPGFGKDIVADFEGGVGAGDVISLSRSMAKDFSAVMKLASNIGNDCVLTFGNNTSITLAGFKKENLAADDFRFV